MGAFSKYYLVQSDFNNGKIKNINISLNKDTMESMYFDKEVLWKKDCFNELKKGTSLGRMVWSN